MSQQARRLYEFGPFRIDTANRLLLRDGKPVALKPKVVDTLLVLIENSGRVLEKDELIQKLWPDSFVEEGNLTQNVYEIRKALDSGEEAESYIETIPRRGYRFAVPVKELPFAGGAVLPVSPGDIAPVSENAQAASQRSENESPEKPFAPFGCRARDQPRSVFPAMGLDLFRSSGRLIGRNFVPLFGLQKTHSSKYRNQIAGDSSVQVFERGSRR
jgi:DNA-binding winged helix-turn-helix (wHTH) protein